MPQLICLIMFFVFSLSMPAYSRDKDSSLERAIDGVFSDNDHSGKGKGRPDNPGEHGRENAADKQSGGHGNSSKKEDSWEDKIRDELEDDDEGKDKGKGKKKNRKN